MGETLVVICFIVLPILCVSFVVCVIVWNVRRAWICDQRDLSLTFKDVYSRKNTLSSILSHIKLSSLADRRKSSGNIPIRKLSGFSRQESQLNSGENKVRSHSINVHV